MKVLAFNGSARRDGINQMMVVGSSYSNIGIGRNIGEVNQDNEGIQTVKNLGQNMAWVLKKIYGNRNAEWGVRNQKPYPATRIKANALIPPTRSLIYSVF